tara:strand:- start:7589 stop:8134 length:546 start_codon:yes stop_codon:yes gene_type:complete
VFAGVGSPIKEVVWRVSKLNFANLKREKKGIKRAVNGTKFTLPKPLKKDSIQEENDNLMTCEDSPSINSDDCKTSILTVKTTIIITPGTTPKVTMSAKESNCFPSSPFVLNKRAEKPSRKSKNAPAKTHIAAANKCPVTAKIIARIPEIKLKEVNRFAKLNILMIFILKKKSTIYLIFTSK